MKQIIFYIIAIIGAFALYFWKENEILAGGFVALVLYIGAKYKENELKKENAVLRVMHKAEFRKNQINTNMATLIGNLEIIKAQSQWVEDYGQTHPSQALTVLNQQQANLVLMIDAAKNDTINPTLTPPPPAP